MRSWPPKTEASHGLDDRTDHVCGAADGRCGLYGGPGGVHVGVSGPLPVQDRVGANEEDAGRILGAPGEKASDLEDPEALGGCEVGPLPLRELSKARPEDLGDLPGQAGAQFGLFQARLELGERIVLAAQLPQMRARGKSHQMGSGEGGAERETLGGLVDDAAQA